MGPSTANGGPPQPVTGGPSAPGVLFSWFGYVKETNYPR
jgi:hypothetical protein